MTASFTPEGDWFVFDNTGRTLKRGFKTKPQAMRWIAEQEKADGPRPRPVDV